MIMMRTHINNVLSSCYGSSRQIRSTKRSLPVHALNTLVTGLVYSRLDYCNVVFAGLPACDLHPLISVAARLVTNASRRDHVTPLLCERHWLPIQQCMDYKLCVMVHRCLHERVPSYLLELITLSAAAHSRAGLRSSELRTVAVPRTVSSLGDRAFAVATPRARNSLPFFLRSIDSTGGFKKNLKSQHTSFKCRF